MLQGKLFENGNIAQMKKNVPYKTRRPSACQDMYLLYRSRHSPMCLHIYKDHPNSQKQLVLRSYWTAELCLNKQRNSHPGKHTEINKSGWLLVKNIINNRAIFECSETDRFLGFLNDQRDCAKDDINSNRSTIILNILKSCQIFH